METNSSNTFLPLAVVAAGVMIAGSVIWSNAHPSVAVANPGQQQAGAAAAIPVDIKDVKTDGEPFIGNPTAPVTIAFWSDFQCPYCKNFELTTLPQIVQDYISTGKVKMVFFDFAFLGKDSTTAGEYNRAIWKLYPQQYYAWRTAMYNAQDAEGDTGFGNAASIDKLNATIAGLDAAKISADVSANKAAYDAQNSDDRTQAAKFGINATPSFVIGTSMIPGALPYSEFQKVIDPLVK